MAVCGLHGLLDALVTEALAPVDVDRMETAA
jgi:hypothetical protein